MVSVQPQVAGQVPFASATTGIAGGFDRARFGSLVENAIAGFEFKFRRHFPADDPAALQI